MEYLLLPTGADGHDRQRQPVEEGLKLTPLLVIAALGAIALVVGKLARRFVPEIVVFLGLGVLVGPQGPLQIINERNIASLNLVTVVALGLIIFLLGDRLRFDHLRTRLGVLLPLNLIQVAVTVLMVFGAALAAGADARLAFVLAVIAAETGVLTVTATVREERASGTYTERLLASVGLTNVIVAVLFGVTFPFVLAASPGAGPLAMAMSFGQIVVGSTVIGLLGGWILTRFGAAIETSGELLLFLLITLTGVAALDLLVDGSVVVSTLIAGIFVANRAPWLADRFFAAVRTLEAPIYLIFFVVAGAGIHLDELSTVGLMGGVYVVARAVAKIAGSVIGGRLARPAVDGRQASRLGVGMLPHAGMAIALVAFVVEQAPLLADDVSAVVLGSIVLFELGGPVLLRRSLRTAGDAGRKGGDSEEPVLHDLDELRGFHTVVIPVGNIRVVLPRLAFLLELVRNLGAELVLVHITPPGQRTGQSDEPEVLKLARRLAEERNIHCRTVHRVSEHIASAIAQTVKEEDADLLIMGEPLRQSVFESTGWGRTTQRVEALIDVPMLVYPVDPHDPGDVPSFYVRRAVEAEQRDGTADSAAGRRPDGGGRPSA